MTKAFFIFARLSAFSILQQHVPAPALPYCLHLHERYPFRLKLRQKRQTKVGDFSFRPGRPLQITLNRDLHPLLFLMTYVHEVAHVAVHLHFGPRTEPHGVRWKKMFQDLMAPLLREEVFPAEVLTALQKHMINPKASTFADSKLVNALRQADSRTHHDVQVSALPEGALFRLNGRWFRKGVSKRTRAVCQEVGKRSRYLVPLDAVIEEVQLLLL